jgi:sugar lactone lactonase YvrE
MSRLGLIRTILLVAGLASLLSAAATAQRLYVDAAWPKNDIWRYDADLSPAPAPGQTGIVFADLNDSTGTSQYKYLEVGPNDNYLYVTAYYDYPPYNWSDGCEYVTRYDRTTGLKDTSWKVWLRGDTTANHGGDLTFAPDGRLYASETNFGGVHLVDIASQTSMNVLPDFSTYANGIAFDPSGSAYVTTSGGVVKKYFVSGTTWTPDTSYAGTVPGGGAYGLTYGPDGYLYVCKYSGGYIYRLNSAGIYDPSWSAQAVTGVAIDMDFGPDGRLYVNAFTKVLSLDVTTKTWLTVYEAGVGQYYGEGISWDLTPSGPGILPTIPTPGTQAMYLDDAYVNDILRYDTDGNGYPAPSQSGAVFANLPDNSGTSQYHCVAYHPNDGFLYVTSPYDRSPYQWGDGSQYVTRFNTSTGAKDTTWKVWLRGDSTANIGGDLAFAPNRRLYAVETNFGGVYYVDIAAKSSTLVLSGVNPKGITFDPLGAAYVSSWNTNTVQRYTVSGLTWTRDTSFNGTIPLSTGCHPYMMVYGPDGWLYVNDYLGGVFRLNSAGVYDPGWYINTGTISSGGMSFGPDGKLYVACASGGIGGAKRCRTDMNLSWDWDAMGIYDFFVRRVMAYGTYVSDLDWANVPGRLTGHVDLQDYAAGSSPVAVEIKFLQSGVTKRTEPVLLDSSGNYNISNVDWGIYDISFKASSWLPKVVSDVIVLPSGGNAALCNVSLVNGDLNGDSSITSTDAGVVLPNLDTKGK